MRLWHPEVPDVTAAKRSVAAQFRGDEVPGLRAAIEDAAGSALEPTTARWITTRAVLPGFPTFATAGDLARALDAHRERAQEDFFCR